MCANLVQETRIICAVIYEILLVITSESVSCFGKDNTRDCLQLENLSIPSAAKIHRFKCWSLQIIEASKPSSKL